MPNQELAEDEPIIRKFENQKVHSSFMECWYFRYAIIK